MNFIAKRNQRPRSGRDSVTYTCSSVTIGFSACQVKDWKSIDAYYSHVDGMKHLISRHAAFLREEQRSAWKMEQNKKWK